MNGLGLLGATLVTVLAPAREVDFRDDPPNVVLLMADDLGWGDVGFNGNEIIATPHLDAMAANGLRFERFYAAAPVCSPTRGSALTGRHPSRYGITGANAGHLPEEEWTLAELLAQRGYATGHFGKWHLGTLTTTVRDSNRGGPRGAQHFAPPWEHGFDVCFSTEAKVPTWDPMKKPGTDEPYGTSYWTEDGAPARENLAGDDSRVIMDRVLPFVTAAAEREQPFFAVVWFHAPHLPVIAGPEYREPYARFGEKEQHYYGCVTALDEQVGRLRAALRELDVAENTLVWFCSDNGPEGDATAPGSTGGLRGRKRDLFEGGVRVPAVVEWPARVAPGTETRVPAMTSDYLPTVMAALGAKLPGERPLDGESLMPLFSGEMKARSKPIAFHTRGDVALVDHDVKLIRVARGVEEGREPPWRIYDLGVPGERHDLYPGHERARAMVETLAEWRASCERSAARADYP